MNELVTGLATGIVHVWMGADHVAAIAPLAVGRVRRSWVLGVQWGLGHSAGTAVMLLAVHAMYNPASTRTLSAWGELTAGALLIGMSLWHLRTASPKRGLQTQGQLEVSAGSSHGRSMLGRWLRDRWGAKPVAFGFGVVHGVAGGSSLVAILMALTFTSALHPLLFFAGFAVGSLLAMSVLSFLMGRVGQIGRISAMGVGRTLRVTVAVASGLVGVYWLMRSPSPI